VTNDAMTTSWQPTTLVQCISVKPWLTYPGCDEPGIRRRIPRRYSPLCRASKERLSKAARIQGIRRIIADFSKRVHVGVRR
jgi:hypothetical protein